MDFLTDIAEWCMPFLYFLRDIGNPVFDCFFETITHLGEETVFLVISIVFFWCVDKREGYFILLSGLFGTLMNQTAKLACRVPRPWVIDKGFLPIGNSIEEATGYSFPSGHTQNVATTFGAIAAYKKGRTRVAVCTVIIALVAFSRMYLGVHTPLDVVVSLAVSAALVLIFRPWFETEEKFNRAYPRIVIISVICSFAFLAFVLFVSNDRSLDAANYNSALKNACTLLGCTVGLVLVFVVDTMFVNFQTEAKWYAQIIKAVVGFAIVLLIKSGLSAPLTAIFGNEYVARIIRYFLIVAFAGAVWPLTFKKFGEMRIKALDNLTEKIKAKFTKNA